MKITRERERELSFVIWHRAFPTYFPTIFQSLPRSLFPTGEEEKKSILWPLATAPSPADLGIYQIGPRWIGDGRRLV